VFVYHWSPSARRVSILQQGLVLYANPTVQTARYPYICFGASPQIAWNLSAQTLVDDEACGDAWDLWEVKLTNTDQIEFLTSWGYDIYEIRSRKSIPADRLWLVGCRPVLHGLRDDGSEGETCEPAY